MIIERGRKYFDLRERSKIEEGRPTCDCSVLAETPHEADLRVAVDAARVDAIVIGCGTIAIKAEMNGILSDRSGPDERCRCPQQKRGEPHWPVSIGRSRTCALPVRCRRTADRQPRDCCL